MTKIWNTEIPSEAMDILNSDLKIYPERKNVFKAFDMNKEDIKVVIIGQDPYFNEEEAMGLSFSVPKNIKTPPSLKNIFKELKEDLGIENTSPDLSPWAAQGVMLLNSALTVIPKKPGSHAKIWEPFTNQIISNLSEQKDIVYILWGGHAQKKRHLIQDGNLIIESPHPSPLGAYRGFWGSKPFSKTNNYLLSKGKNIINWQT